MAYATYSEQPIPNKTGANLYDNNRFAPVLICFIIYRVFGSEYLYAAEVILSGKVRQVAGF